MAVTIPLTSSTVGNNVATQLPKCAIRMRVASFEVTVSSNFLFDCSKDASCSYLSTCFVNKKCEHKDTFLGKNAKTFNA